MTSKFISRRTVVQGAAWALPAVAVSSQAAAQCVSGQSGHVLECSQITSGELLGWSTSAKLTVKRDPATFGPLYPGGDPYGSSSVFDCGLGNMHWVSPAIVDCETGKPVVATHVSLDPSAARGDDAVSVQTVGEVDADGTMHEGASVLGVRQWPGRVFGSFIAAPRELVTEGQNDWFHIWIEATTPCEEKSSCNAPSENNRALKRLLISLPMTVTFHRMSGDKELWHTNGCPLYFNMLMDTERGASCSRYKVINHPTTNDPMVWFSQSRPTVVA